MLFSWKAKVWLRDFSFTDFKVQYNSKPVQVCEDIGFEFGEDLAKQDQFFQNKFLVFGNIRNPDKDN